MTNQTPEPLARVELVSAGPARIGELYSALEEVGRVVETEDGNLEVYEG